MKLFVAGLSVALGLVTWTSAGLIVNTNAISTGGEEGNFYISADSVTLTERTTNITPFVVRSSAGWLTPVPTNGTCDSNGTYITLMYSPEYLTAGNYYAKLRIEAPGTTNQPISVAVSLAITPSPVVLRCNVGPLTNTFVAGSTNVLSIPADVWNGASSPATMEYRFENYMEGVSVSPTSGVCKTEIRRHYITLSNLATLAIGDYYHNIAVEETNGAQKYIMITLHVTASNPAAAFSTNQISVSTVQGVNPSNRTFSIWNRGEQTLDYRTVCPADWLSCSPTNGSCTTETNALSLSFDTSALATGSYRSAVQVYAPSTNLKPRSIFVSLTVLPYSSVLNCATSLLQGGRYSSGIYTQHWPIWNSGTGSMSYAISENTSWLTISPTNGTSVAGARNYHTVRFASAGLDEGTHTGLVTVVAPNAHPATQQVSTVFRIISTLTISPPFVTNQCLEGFHASNVTVRMWNADSTNTIAYTLSKTAAWLQLNTTNGASHGDTNQFVLSFLSTNLAPGVYADQIRVSSAQFTAFIPVQLTIEDFNGEHGEKILFYSTRYGNADIWMVEPDGQNPQVLIRDAGNQTDPQLSPDGTKLAYRDDSSGVTRLKVRDLLTETVTDYGDLENARWLSDGSGLIGNDPTNLAAVIWRAPLVGARTSFIRELDRLTLFGQDFFSGKIYYTVDPGYSPNTVIKSFDHSTSNRVILKGADRHQDAMGRVSPDGQLVSYARSVSLVGNPRRIHLLDTATSVERSFSSNLGNTDRESDFSPDGRSLVFARLMGNGTNTLVVADLATTNEITIFTDSHLCLGPIWGNPYLWRRPVMEVTPLSLINTIISGTTNPPTAKLTLRNSGWNTLNYSISNETPWVQLDAASGTSTGESDVITVSFDTKSLDVGTHTGRLVVVADSTNSPIIIPVTTTVEPPLPIIACDTATLNAQLAYGTGTCTKTFTVRNAGGRTLSYTISDNRTWMNALPASGSSTGEEDEITITFQATDLSLHSTNTGTISLSSAGLATQTIAATLCIVMQSELPKQLAVSALSFSNSVTENRNPPNQTFEIWNSGGNTLTDWTQENANWFSLMPSVRQERPYTSAGERDRVTIQYTTDVLTQGFHQASIRVGSDGGTQQVNVAVNVLPPLQYALTLMTHGSGTVTRAPQSASYSDLTSVHLTAFPAAGYEFIHWGGGVQGASTSGVVVMDSSKTVHAYFEPRARVWGYVTNTASGQGINTASLYLGNHVTHTVSSGYYSFTPAPGLYNFEATRLGYESSSIVQEVSPHTTTRRDFGLAPNMITINYARQRPNTTLVDISYYLEGKTNDAYVVEVYLSSVGGASWDVASTSFQGSANMNIPAKSLQDIVWNAGVDWPQNRTDNMRLALRTCGFSFTSQPFTVDTRWNTEWLVRAWADRDRNGQYDPGEGLPNAEVYYGNCNVGTTPTALTDNQGLTWITNPVSAGRSLFIRAPIYSLAAEKPRHTAVSNTMYTLWLDNDRGQLHAGDAWDGIWNRYTITEQDLDLLYRGETLESRLRHPVFEWNLTVAAEAHNTNWIAQFGTGMARASTYLYDITDGQMKFGIISLTTGVSRSSDAWKKADIVVYANDDYRANAYIGSIYKNDNKHISLGRAWKGYQPDESGYYSGIVHEFGHYALKFWDEYLSALADKASWKLYRANHTNDNPQNYGLMDYHYNVSEMSSDNDYPAAYPPLNVEVNDPFRISKLMNYMSTMTMQVWQYRVVSTYSIEPEHLPCWARLKIQFHKNYNGIPVSIITPPNGVYENGRSTSEDRPGPTDIPGPYSRCTFKSPLGTTRMSMGDSDAWYSEPAYVLVTFQGSPAANAVVTLLPAREQPRIIVLGKTDRSGRIALEPWTPGDRLAAYWNGRETMLNLTALNRSENPLCIELEQANRLTKQLPQPLTPGGMGLLLLPSFTTSSNITLTLQSGLALATNPLATLYISDAISNDIPMSGSGNLYSGELALDESLDGSIHLRCTLLDDSEWITWDGFNFAAMNSEDQRLYSPNGIAEFTFGGITSATTYVGFIYQGNGPVFIPAGFTHTNQIGSVYACALADGSILSSNTPASLNLQYEDDDVVGIDETTLLLHQWDPATTNWAALDAAQDPSRNTFSVLLTNTGAFALFGDASNDTNPPAAIADLEVQPGDSPATLDLTWTATGDDDTNGTAYVYHARFDTNEITEANWDSAQQLLVSQTPQPAGTIEGVHVNVPTPDTVYYIALRAADEAGNWSLFTNSVAARSGTDDADGDGISDVWLASANALLETPMGTDDDTDGDGLTTFEEYAVQTDPNNADTDGDGMSDGWEINYNLDPNEGSDAELDSDGDGRSNITEYGDGTNPRSTDTDSDGMSDPWEKAHNLDPLTAGGQQGGDADIDGDRFSNAEEYTADTDPNDPDSYLHFTELMERQGGLYLAWQGGEVAAQYIECVTNLFAAPEDWAPIFTNIPPTGLSVQWTNTEPCATTTFFRIRAERP